MMFLTLSVANVMKNVCFFKKYLFLLKPFKRMRSQPKILVNYKSGCLFDNLKTQAYTLERIGR